MNHKAVVVVIAILVFLVSTVVRNQDLLLHCTVGNFELVMSDSSHESATYTFSHYSNDVVRAISWMQKNGSLIHNAPPRYVSYVLSDINGCDKYTPFVRASMSYLRACKVTTPVIVGVVVNMRHHLKDSNAPGNYLRIETCTFDPSGSNDSNATELKKCISRGKHKRQRNNNVSFIINALKCNVILNSWSVKSEDWFIAPPSKQVLCSSPLYDGRRRFAVLSNMNDVWYVRYERYL